MENESRFSKKKAKAKKRLQGLLYFGLIGLFAALFFTHPSGSAWTLLKFLIVSIVVAVIIISAIYHRKRLKTVFFQRSPMSGTGGVRTKKSGDKVSTKKMIGTGSIFMLLGTLIAIRTALIGGTWLSLVTFIFMSLLACLGVVMIVVGVKDWKKEKKTLKQA